MERTNAAAFFAPSVLPSPPQTNAQSGRAVRAGMWGSLKWPSASCCVLRKATPRAMAAATSFFPSA